MSHRKSSAFLVFFEVKLFGFRSNNSLVPTTPTNPAKNIKLVPLEQLIIHSSDTVVKPITGNREIEKIPDTTFAKENLPFTLYKPEDVSKHIDSSQIENHLLDIYNYLSIFKFEQRFESLF